MTAVSDIAERNPRFDPQRVAVVTGADSKYYPLLEDLLDSLAAGPLASRMSLCVIDGGLSPDHRRAVTDRGATVVAPDWMLDWPSRATTPAYFHAIFDRPFLPQLFPGYDIYIWLDSDLWVQDDGVLADLVSTAQSGRLAIVPEIDRGYWTLYKKPKFWGQNQKAFAWNYGLNAGYRYGRNAILNSGVLALPAEAPHWRLWQNALNEALNRRALRKRSSPETLYFRLAEQTALNAAIFRDKAPAGFFPATANWFCGKGDPKFDRATARLVEPHPPYRPLSIVHLAGVGMKERVWELETLTGDTVRTRLTWRAIRDLRPSPRPAEAAGQ